jgi:hypothetical protein
MKTYDYCPDNWIVFEKEIDGKKERFVLAGWSGGYLDGDSWRRNSGIKSVTQDDEFLYFKGYSGSVYKCHKQGYGVRANIGWIWEQIQKVHEYVTEVSLEKILEELENERA